MFVPTTRPVVDICISFFVNLAFTFRDVASHSSSLSSPLAASPAGKWVCRPQGKSCKRCQKYCSSMGRRVGTTNPFAVWNGLWFMDTKGIPVYQHTENLETFNISARTHPCGSLCMVLLWISLNKWTSIIKYTVLQASYSIQCTCTNYTLHSIYIWLTTAQCPCT